jgi:hypothetical protein
MKTRVRRLLLLSLTLSCIASLCAAPAPAPAAEDDVVFRALTDEMKRSMSDLKLKGHDKPYFLSYWVEDRDVTQISASFGALSERHQYRDRNLSASVRVGDYNLDNTRFSTGGGFIIFMGGSSGRRYSDCTLDNDYDGLRHELWLKTDEAYKQAVENLEGKKAYLRQNTVVDRPPDFSCEQPVVLVEKPVTVSCDKERWSGTVRRLSAVFKEYPKIDQSSVMFEQDGINRWFINSEGTKTFIGKPEYALMVMAAARAEDGTIVRDSEAYYSPKEPDSAAVADMEKRVKQMAESLTMTASTPILEDYTGPVLFEGEGAGEFILQTLGPSFNNPLESLGSSYSTGTNPLRDRIGMRVLPSFVSVIDDPQATEFKGEKLYGGEPVDEDGVRPQKITLVEKGILKTFCSSRTPGRYVQSSNGHARFGSASISNLFVIPEVTTGKKALYAKLRKLGKEEGLKYVLVVRRLQNQLSSMIGPRGRGFWRVGAGAFSLTVPSQVYKVDVETGKEELTRTTAFSGVGLGTLRDIVGMGNDASAYSVLRSPGMSDFEPLSVITPSILVKELDLQKRERDIEKGPILVNPHFEKKD